MNQKTEQMKTMKYKLLACILFCLGVTFAQTKLEKTSQSIKVAKDVTLDLNTNYCAIELDTWNKDVIEIEAYIEGEKLSKEELQEALKNWDLNVDATTKMVTITSKGSGRNIWNAHQGNDHDDIIIIQDLKHKLADMPEIHIEHLEHLDHIVIPELSELPELPELPAMPKGFNDINFDYEAYKKDGEKYLEKWGAKFDKKFGKEYEQKMEAWSKKYEEKMKAWEKKFEKENEHRLERAEKRREQLEERLEKREVLIEKRLQQKEALINKRNKERKVLIEKRHTNKAHLFNNNNNNNVKKTIKIRMPKKTNVKVNVRHGELNLVSNINNLNATLAYTKLAANSINGSNTSINASYSPLNVTSWNYGKLNLNYVESATLDNVKSILLTTNSSNIKINNLINNAMINSNFGDVKILKLNDAFSNVNMTLENSNAVIVLPNSEHNVQFIGNNSRLIHPKNSTSHKTNSFSDGNANNPKRIVVNAKYSVVDMH